MSIPMEREKRSLQVAAATKDCHDRLLCAEVPEIGQERYLCTPTSKSYRISCSEDFHGHLVSVIVTQVRVSSTPIKTQGY